MEKLIANFKPALSQIVNSSSRAELDNRMAEIAARSRYDAHLHVAWDFWHYGRHAEFAEEVGKRYLGALFSAAWKVEHRVFGTNTPEDAQTERDAIFAETLDRVVQQSGGSDAI